MGRDVNVLLGLLNPFYFNSHAHVGRDAFVFNIHPTHPISTHTPTWGVTGGTLLIGGETDDFNSHAHVGRDLN